MEEKWEANGTGWWWSALFTNPFKMGLSIAKEPGQKLRPTAYLDGLRGFAAFLVYWHHHQLWARPLEQSKFLETAYGFEGQYYFAALPGIRTFFYGGHFAVATFFVISGFVLSVMAMDLVH